MSSQNDAALYRDPYYPPGGRLEWNRSEDESDTLVMDEPESTEDDDE